MSDIDAPCGHPKRFGLFGLPKESGGCLACAYEQARAEIERLRAERDALKADAERFAWLAERLEDVHIDGADPLEHYSQEEGDADEEVPYLVLWRRAIDSARKA